MKKFSSELGHNYESYTFGYTNYCERELGDSISDIYASGYLPYSGAKHTQDNFYMARSARVALSEFSLTSENRRIAKKFDEAFEKERVPFGTFDQHESFIDFCLAYFAARHGERIMSRERLHTILKSGIISTVVVYKKESDIIAYVLEVEDGSTGHYWFSFYDVSFTNQSLGMWLMLDCIRDAKTRRLEHYYLGTVYGEKALYKTNFEPLEWWDGSKWNSNTPLLKERGRSDMERTTVLTDAWKDARNLF